MNAPRTVRTVRDVMSTNLLYLREGERAELARPHLLAFGVTAVPVLDDAHRPVGVVSLRDVVGQDPRGMSCPAQCIAADEPVETAARLLAASGRHHLVVVDDDGVAVGMLSALDVLRALVDVEVTHPTALTSFDEAGSR